MDHTNHYANSPRKIQGIQRSANRSQSSTVTPELHALVMFLIQHIRKRLQPQFRAVNHPIMLDTALDINNQSYKMTGFAKHAYSDEKEQYLQQNFLFYFLRLKHKGSQEL